MSSKKLWQANDKDTNPLVHSYTVGDDYIFDNQLLPYDVLASLAHAQMLQEMNVLTKNEFKQLADCLNQLLAEWKAGKFKVTQEDEDCHTAIENYLTKKLGATGKKIHAGRSRNDQALVMIRLYARQQIEEITGNCQELVKELQGYAEASQEIAMPGYTHLQPAMPTTVGTWLGSFADGYSDSLKLVQAVGEIVDQNPLGSASGFGINNFPLRQEVTTKLLAFSKSQQNPMYAGLSRGLFESVILNSLSPLMILAGKFANDMLLFTTAEFDFFSLPPSFTTGSSIMPQKRNYDVFEIMRGNADIYQGYQQQIQNLVSHKGSGYQRDLALTKQPFIKGIELLQQTLAVLIAVIPNIKINEERLKAAMTDDLYQTEKVYELVKQGMAFRDAYIQVKKTLNT